MVTGGLGFIGSNFIRRILSVSSGCTVINLDALTYAGNPANLADMQSDPRYVFIKGEIQDRALVESVFREHSPGIVVNFAAESHVDRSIIDSRPFLDTNVQGTLCLLDAAIKHGVRKYVQVSTDEVYGSLGSEGYFTEETPLAPNSPYSASKAAADLFVRAYHHTHRLPAVITRCSNNYGPYQFPEKLIPLMISNAGEGKKLPVYGDGLNVRDWIHVDDHCDAVIAAMEKGRPGEVYNIGSDNERANLDLVRSILALMGKKEDMIEFVADRPGHDRRYAIDSSKIKNELQWRPKVDFEKGLEDTIRWYHDNAEWLEGVKSGGYRKYYELNYGKR